MTAIFLIARDSVRALLHRRLLMALMLVMLILTVLFSVVLSQANRNIILQTAPPPSAAAMAEQGGEAAQPDAQAAVERALEGMDEAQREQMRQNMQAAGAQMLSTFYGFTAFGGILVAIFIGATAVASDVRSGAIIMILARPVARWQFLLGKYGGAMSVLLAYSALTAVALVIFTQVHGLDAVPAIRYSPWLMFCQNLIYASLALVLSMLVHPAIAGVLAFFIQADWFSQLLSSSNPFYYLHFLLPTYSPFNATSQFLSGTLVGLDDVAILTLYALDLTAIFLLLAMWRFRSKAVV